MKIKEKTENHVAVLTLSGKMMGGPETTALHDHIRGLMGDGIKKVVIDLTTHEAGGLSELDFQLAIKIEQLI